MDHLARGILPFIRLIWRDLAIQLLILTAVTGHACAEGLHLVLFIASFFSIKYINIWGRGEKLVFRGEIPGLPALNETLLVHILQVT